MLNSRTKQLKITVTGCDGFVGFHLARALARAGHEVVAACQHNLVHLQNTLRITPVQIDLTKPETLPDCLNQTDCVVHCAALLDIAASQERLNEINVQGTANLLAAARDRNVKRFIFFSTAEVYSTPHLTPVTEEHPLGPGTPYGQSKLAAEHLIQQARQEWGLQTIILRPSLVYGPRCVYVGGLFILPLILKEIGIRSLPLIRGTMRFNCVHVDDVVGAVEYLVNYDKGWGSVYNLADNNMLEMEAFLNILYRSFGFKAGHSFRYPQKILAMCSRLGKHLPLLWWFPLFVACINAYWRKICRRYQLQPILRLPLLGPCILHFFRAPGNFMFDNSRILATGYRFVCPSFDEGLNAMLNWYRANRWVP